MLDSIFKFDYFHEIGKCYFVYILFIFLSVVFLQVVMKNESTSSRKSLRKFVYCQFFKVSDNILNNTLVDVWLKCLHTKCTTVALKFYTLAYLVSSLHCLLNFTAILIVKVQNYSHAIEITNNSCLHTACMKYEKYKITVYLRNGGFTWDKKLHCFFSSCNF